MGKRSEIGCAGPIEAPRVATLEATLRGPLGRQNVASTAVATPPDGGVAVPEEGVVSALPRAYGAADLHLKVAVSNFEP